MDMSVQKFLKRREIAEASRKAIRRFTTDEQFTYDRATVDSTGVFLVGQLERLDQTLNEPLVEFTWSRDIEIRTDVSPADEIASWTNSAFAMSGGINPGGLNWISNEGNALAGPSLDIGKTPQPMRLWGAEVKYTVPELVKAQKLGMPVDAQKVEGIAGAEDAGLLQLGRDRAGAGARGDVDVGGVGFGRAGGRADGRGDEVVRGTGAQENREEEQDG